MNQINIATKKFTDAVKIDIGQLPVTDVKIDFNLTDGTNPVIAENKTFTLTIGTVQGELYKTDDDTVSYRYLKFDDNNVADSLAITMKMNGEEILNDTVSLTYQTSGGGSSVTVDSEMSESSPNPVANSTLTPIINGKADKATTIAGYGITDAYTKTELSTVATTGSYNDLSNKPDLTTKLDAPATGTVGQVLTKTEDGQEWADAPAGGGGEDTTDYLCFTTVDENNTVRLDKQGTPPAISLEYSTDKRNWTEYTWSGNTGATISLVNVGDKVWWRGNNTTLATNYNNYHQFTISLTTEASGNIMSLLDKKCNKNTVPEHCFINIFNRCVYLTTAPKLPATTLANYCYSGMFANCSSLTKAPELPATSLTDSCYSGMFADCSSLTEAPELPATSLTDECYYYMFENCHNLNRIKVNFTNWIEYMYTTNSWLSGVSSTGVFQCPSALDCSTRDASHVPAGWTIVRTDSPKSITSPTTASSEATYEVSPNTPSVPVVTVAFALTLNASTLASTDVAYSEIVLDVATGATVTSGTNLTLVDTPTAGKRNICVCRWSGGVCKLYVTIVEDLPQA